VRVCVVGSGGREHALAVALARTADVVVSPGNAGMAALGVRCVRGPVESIEADMFVVGPEAPLVDGLADKLRSLGRLVFGPGSDGARLEGSKVWMKELLAGAGVPTARFGAFTEAGPALEFLRSLPGPWVVKTDGLAAGKGVLVTTDRSEAEADVRVKLSGAAFGAAGRTVVIEEFLEGTELSLMAVCDGRTAWPLAPAQDFKRVATGDRGPNTGGMGAYSPVPGASAVVARVMAEAVQPTLDALSARGIEYRGLLYAGLMLTLDGPRVLEFNVRFGDPETQVVLPRWEGDVAGVLGAAAGGRLAEDVAPPVFSSDAAVCVVLAAPGYPAAPEVGSPIEGLSSVVVRPDVQVFCAAVAEEPAAEGRPRRLVTAGGRVLGVTATGSTLDAARRRAYQAVPDVSWPGIHYRTDIAAAATGLGA
jgi:phosphoribosylamine--glycine ligase